MWGCTELRDYTWAPRKLVLGPYLVMSLVTIFSNDVGNNALSAMSLGSMWPSPANQRPHGATLYAELFGNLPNTYTIPRSGGSWILGLPVHSGWSAHQVGGWAQARIWSMGLAHLLGPIPLCFGPLQTAVLFHLKVLLTKSVFSILIWTFFLAEEWNKRKSRLSIIPFRF